MKKLILLFVVSYSCYTFAMEGNMPDNQADLAKRHALTSVIVNSCTKELRVKDTCKEIADYIVGCEPIVKAYYADETMKKLTVDCIKECLTFADDRSHYAVAKVLAKHIPVYQPMVRLIEDAFNPQCSVHDKWYANAIKYMESKQESYVDTTKTIGRHGGLMTPLSFAIKKANFNWVGRLILQGANVNQEYPNLSGGKTHALFEAVSLKNRLKNTRYGNKNTRAKSVQKQQSYDNIIHLLLCNGARVDLNFFQCTKGSLPITPLKLAIHHKDRDSVLLLTNHGAEIAKDSLNEDDRQWFESI